MSRQNETKSGRRGFVKATALGVGAAALGGRTVIAAANSPDRFQILAALGETIIPSKPGDPGFKDLEPQGIVQEVNKNLVAFKDDAFSSFNQGAAVLFQGKTFLELSEEDR